MTYYQTDIHFRQNLTTFFDLMQVNHIDAVQEILDKRLLVIIEHTRPSGIITLDGRRPPLTPSFIKPKERADLYIKTGTDTLHHVLLGEEKLTKAIGSKKLVFKGSLRTAMTLADLFYASQASYQLVIRQDRPS
jgi:hypothetical protein